MVIFTYKIGHMSYFQHHDGIHHFSGVDFSYRTVSHCQFSDPWTNHPHLHRNHYEICLVTSGRGKYLHGSQSFSLAKGDVFVADPEVVHEISSPQSKDLELVFGIFTIEPRESGHGIESNLLRSFHKHHKIHQSDCFDLLPYVELLSRPDLEARPGGASIAQVFILEMIRCLDVNETSYVASSKYLERAKGVIAKWSGRDFGLEELADASECSLRTLRREVRKSSGQNLSDWVHGLRLEQAAQLLRMNFRIGETAAACGYDDPDRFTRLFKRRYGMTPKKFQLEEIEFVTQFVEKAEREP